MQITITGQHLDLTDPIKNYVDEKIGRLGRYFDHVIHARAVLKHLPHENLVNVADITVNAPGHIFHAEVHNADMYAAIDLVADKLEAQVHSYKEKLQDRRNDHPTGLAAIAEAD
ncbi:ribosome-associated translation inhibitor RaiA [Acidithiobacillus ferrianus]|uniref:Ribosome hibernation promoting factor n=2 Tax=Acidithiobacillus ferrianus TaxID=2678518 RepID=A0A845U7W7_9PROT|nr:ribosome-associated translation inhibitor RaiA [Acidithiobacillus ferrianus]NDU41615.1 ribosome-associated translation inhibitor RaiA [Acidithiobacillus ferrianus]